MPAVAAAFYKELALLGDDDHFWCTAIAAGQGLFPMDYLSSRRRRITTKKAAATALNTNNAIR